MIKMVLAQHQKMPSRNSASNITGPSLSAELDPLLTVVEGDDGDLGAHEGRGDEVRAVVADEPLEGAGLADAPFLIIQTVRDVMSNISERLNRRTILWSWECPILHYHLMLNFLQFRDCPIIH